MDVLIPISIIRLDDVGPDSHAHVNLAAETKGLPVMAGTVPVKLDVTLGHQLWRCFGKAWLGLVHRLNKLTLRRPPERLPDIRAMQPAVFKCHGLLVADRLKTIAGAGRHQEQ